MSYGKGIKDETKDDDIIQPRTLRLLKLICSSHTSSDHIRQAIKLLSITASRSSPTVLWDIIFRLYNSLTYPDEDSAGGCCITRRENVALAIENVAMHIPKTDQHHFLSDTNDSLFLSGADNSFFLTVKSLLENDCDAIVLDRIISHGKQLLSSDESKYDMDITNDWRKEDALKHLASLPSDHTSTTEFVTGRVKMQKSILSQRMGLRGLDTFMELDDFTSDLMNAASEIEIPHPTSIDNSKYTMLSESSSRNIDSIRLRNKERLQKRRRLERNTTKEEGPLDTETEHSPAHLLLLKSLQSQSDSKIDYCVSQKNPQLMMASDLMFHSFHPNWHIRHGSLLGLLALLKAWHNTFQQITSGQNEPHFNIGQWPQDILTRCLCIIGLDRFNDFSGLTLENIQELMHSRSHNKAVVRDAAAQVVSFLFVHNTEIQNDCIRVLSHLLSNENSWDVRHGSVTTLRWILLRSSSHRALHMCDTIIGLIINGLNDSSDDVRSASADLLSILVSLDFISNEQRNDYIRRTAAPLWKAVKCHHVSASNTLQILQTLTDCIKIDCGLVLSSVEASVSQVLHEVGILMRSASKAISFCCLEIIPLITIFLVPGESEKDMFFEYQCILLATLFELYSSTIIYDSIEEDDNANDRVVSCSFYSVLGAAWNSLLGSLQVTMSYSNIKSAHQVFRLLIIRFCALDSISVVSNHYSIDSRIGLIFKSIELSANALVLLLKVLSKELPECSTLFVFVIISLLNSPWNEDFERGCILLKAFVSARLASNIEMKIFHPIAIRILESGSKYFSEIGTACAEDRAEIENKCKSAFKDAIIATSTFPTFSYSDAINLSHDVVQKWMNFLPSPIATSALNSSAISLSYMRTSCALSQAISFFDLKYMPSKLTPLVRNLVTHLKNEECEERLEVTVFAIVSLLQTLTHSDDISQVRAAFKLLNNICSLAQTDSTKIGRCTTQCFNASREIIQELVIRLDQNETLETLEPIWTSISLLISDDSDSFSEKLQVEAAWLLCIVVSMKIKKESSVFAHLIENLLAKVASLACTSPSIVIRNHTIEILLNLCKIDDVFTLSKTLEFIYQYLSSHDDSIRLGSCNLLNSLVKMADSSMCPYIRHFLPRVMSMMIDTVKEIADVSANTFAYLVRLSPLVSYDDKDLVEFGSKDTQISNEVIDHLILGKPLPQYTLPPKLQSIMSKNGIKLRDYQLDGISWMQFLQSVKLNGALCDDMGLGKTIQSLIAVAIAHEEIIDKNPHLTPKSLVVCPLSVSGQWANEIKKLLLGDHIDYAFRYIGTNRSDEWQHKFDRCQVVITSYSTLRSDVDILKRVQWEYCILDEGHLLKNPKTKSAQAARALRSKHKLILTGTPVQNRAHELWAIFDFLMPNYLGTEIEFVKKYDSVIKRSQLPGASPFEVRAATNALKQLHQNVLPFILRREKDKVLQELPDKVYIDIPSCMTPLQRSLYNEVASNKVIKDALSVIDRIVDDSNAKLEKYSNGGSTMKLIGKDALRSLINLRLICTHPSLLDQCKERLSGSLLSFSTSGKLQALNDILRQNGIYQDEITGADNDDSLIYVNESNVEHLDSSDEVMDSSLFENQDSSEKTAEPKVSPTKCLIFAQFTKSLDVVETLLFKHSMPSLRYERIDGRTTSTERDKIITQFDTDDNIRCLLLSTKAGSLGLNLQRANIVIFLEQDWNPFVDEQALSRAHRIGQQKFVQIYRIISEDTIEEKIMKVQELKLEMSKAIVTTENSSFCSMGTERLLDIFDTTNEGL